MILGNKINGYLTVDGISWPKSKLTFTQIGDSFEVNTIFGAKLGGAAITDTTDEDGTPFTDIDSLATFINTGTSSGGGSGSDLLDSNGKIKAQYLPEINLAPYFNTDQFAVVNGVITFIGSGGGTLPIPAAPTAGVVDDTNNTFGFTNAGGLTTLDTEKTLDGGSTYTVNTDNPFSVGDVALAIGQVGVRYKATVNRQASATLFNATAFTSSAGGDADAGFTRITTKNNATSSAVVQTDNRVQYTFDSTNASAYGFYVSSVKVPIGGAFTYRWTVPNDMYSMWTGMASGTQADTNGGMAFPAYGNIKDNYGKMLAIINGNYIDTGNNSYTVPPRIQVRGTGTHVYMEYSLDGGTTWTEFDPATTLAQPQVPLYVKGFANNDGENYAIKDMMQIGMS